MVVRMPCAYPPVCRPGCWDDHSVAPNWGICIRVRHDLTAGPMPESAGWRALFALILTEHDGQRQAAFRGRLALTSNLDCQVRKVPSGDWSDFFWGISMVTHLEFAAVDGTLRQFAASATRSAIQHAARAFPTRYLIDALGSAAWSWDPAWLMAEDCMQSPVGYGGIAYWEPDLAEIRGGQAVSLVVEAYDLTRRAGLRVTVPMVAGRKNPGLRTPVGPESVAEIPVPEVAEPRYENWDLPTFTRWAEAELVRGGAGARKLATYKATNRVPEQKYAEIAEFSGFAYIDRWRSERETAKRTGTVLARQGDEPCLEGRRAGHARATPRSRSRQDGRRGPQVRLHCDLVAAGRSHAG